MESNMKEYLLNACQYGIIVGLETEKHEAQLINEVWSD